jgi:outer membrane receptor protein involved in Fe transport
MAICLISVLFAVDYPVLAQDEDTLLEIDVRGTVRREELQTTSATIMENEDFMDRPYTRPVDLLSSVPGVYLGTQANPGVAHNIFIRGFSGGHGGSSINMYVDGIPLSDNGHAQGYLDTELLLPIELESAEVIKGPASVYYGQQSSGGSIAFETIKSGNFDRLSLRYGSYNNIDIMGILARNGQKIDQVYAFEVFHTDGRQANAERDKYNVSGRWTYKPNDKFQASLIVRAFKHIFESPENMSYLRRSEKDYVDDGSGEGGGGSRERYDARFWANYFINDESQLTYYLYATTLEFWRYSKSERLFNGPATLAFDTIEGTAEYLRHRGLGTGLTYNFKGDIYGKPTTATFGITYNMQVEDPRVIWPLFPGRGRAINYSIVDRYYQHLSLHNPSILGEITYQITDKFNVRAGSRFDWLYGHLTDYKANTDGDSPKYTFWSPKFGLLYTPTDRVGIYFNYSRGFDSPSFNGGAVSGFYADNAFELLDRHQFEIGTRAQITDWMDVDLALYKIFTKNDVSYVEDPTNPAFSTAEPAGKTERYGLDLSVEVRPYTDWRIKGNYSYFRGKYKEWVSSTGSGSNTNYMDLAVQR